jgi:hypothetical protein
MQVVGDFVEATELNGSGKGVQTPTPTGPILTGGLVGLVGKMHFTKKTKDRSGVITSVDINGIVARGTFRVFGKSLLGPGRISVN